MYGITTYVIINWIITAVIGLLTLYLVRFYIKVYKLPYGPFPYPFIGNVLLFKGTKVNQCITIAKLKEVYGPIFTVWFANTPIVFISDLELIRQAFNDPKRNEFNGRPNNIMKKLANTENRGNEIVSADYGPVWTSLRRVAHSATRKLASSDKLLNLITDAVDRTVNTIITKEGINKPFNPFNYLYLTTLNITASSMFGKSYTFNDPEFIYFKDSFELHRQTLGSLNIIDQMPILKPFYYKTFNNIINSRQMLTNKITAKYADHLKDHKHGIIRDVCDGLIEAKQEAIIEAKESAKHLNDDNLASVITDLFRTGNFALSNNLRWVLLLIANNAEMQNRMRKEIKEVIGDRMATQNDKNKCVYVMAFIMECLRYRPGAPFGITHRAMSDANIGIHNIKENTVLCKCIWNVHHDPQHWTNPHIFDPNRFISSDGKEVNGKHAAYMPFGIGRRVCLGRKLALETLFLITVRLLQSTNGYSIVLPNGDQTANLDPNPSIFSISTALPYQIKLKPVV